MQKETMAANPYFKSFYRNNHLRWTLAMTLMILMAPLNLLITWLMGKILDVIAAGKMSALWRLLALTLILNAIGTLTGIVQGRIVTSFLKKALVQYKSLAFRRLSEKSISTFSRENTGRYLSVLTNDVNSIEENYLSQTFDMVFYLLMFIGALTLMFWYSIPLAIAAMALSMLPLIVSLLSGNILTAREKEVSGQNERFVSQAKDLLTGFSVIKSFKAETEARQLFDSVSLDAEEAKRRRNWCANLIQNIAAACGLVVKFGIFFIGAYLAIRGDITSGTVLIFANLTTYLTQPINVIPQFWARRKAARGLIEKLAYITEENAGRSGDAISPVLRDAITLEDVTFGYEPDKPILRNLSLRLEAGKKYALVGASGSGKSTLLNLLMGAYDQYSGSIRLDGKELKTVAPDSLYDLMSLISQNVFLFDDTIERNVTMFRTFPMEEIVSAEERSGLTALLEQQGSDYRCGENGTRLSGGERQRVSIARCLLRKTPVLLLDEATASLDSQTAFAVTNAILRLDGLTRLVVTHRLEPALLEQYDGIFVLRGGQLWEQGDFQALMHKKGYFYSLYTLAGE